MSERWTCRLVNQPRGTQRYHLSKLLRNHRFGSAVFGRVAGEPEAWQAGWGSVIASHLKVSTVAVRPNHSSTSGQ
jgi:hypothetical protein